MAKVNVVHADGPTPTEPPAATEVPTEPTTPTDAATEPTEPPIATDVATEPAVESTPAPLDATPTPEGEVLPTETSDAALSEPATVVENTPVEVILSDVPENTEVVVLDEEGQPMVLGSQAAAEALVASDPVWCPASVGVPTPGANNCSTSYGSITELLDAMRTDPAAFDEDGTIFLENPPGQGFTTPLILDDSVTSLGGSYTTLSAFNLMIQGGWNPTNGTVSGRTNFGVSGGNQGYVLIGSAANPWAGNITLADLHFDLISAANSVTVYTSSGDIVLSNVEVFQQTGTQYTAYLQSTSGDITVGDTSFFDGDNSGNADRNKGFYAETTTGSISITGNGATRTFQDARGNDPANYNGATLSAPIVTLTDVISQDNDGNGIEILNANVVTLNNVIAGTNQNTQGNGLSGVLINGTGSTIVTINGGSFNYNGRYGIEILSSADITTVSNPSYNGNVLGTLYEDTAPNTNLTSTPAPISASTTAGFSFTGSDNYTSAASLSYECSLDGAAFGACTSPVAYSGLSEGNHGFQVRAVDQIGNKDSSPASFAWLIDINPPTINPHGDEFAEATSPSGAVVNYVSPGTFDTVDGAGVASCAPAPGSTFALGDTIVACNATDTAGHTAVPTNFVVHVVDTTAPVIDVHPDETAEATSSAGANVTYTIPATQDAVDGAGFASCAPNSGSIFPLGDTTVTCNLTDNAGNVASPTSFVVHVVDTTAPILDVHPDETAEATSPAGAVVNYASPASLDAVDGAGVASCAPNSGSVFPLGDTTVTCNLTDNAGNTANPTSFVVHVVDTTPPTLNLPANITAATFSPSGIVVNYSASASDLVDGSVSIVCAPASGSTFPLGSTTVNCSAADSHGNSSSGSFVVNVQDPDAPILNLPANIVVEATTPAGAVVNFSASATDAVDGSVPVSCLPASGSVFPVGTSTVNCTASDSSGNTNSAAFLITMEDTTPPTIAFHANITISTSSSAGIIVTYISPATSDIVDGSGTASCSPTSGSLFPIGTTQVVCTAVDAHGNSATPTTFDVTVIQIIVPTIPTPSFPDAPSGFIVPITGGGLVDLNCNSTFWVAGIKVDFLNLCDYQSKMQSVDVNNLPGSLPEGYSFVTGLDFDVFHNGLVIQDLPNQTGVRMDFPLAAASNQQFAVLYWNEADNAGTGEWLEISQEVNEENLLQILGNTAEDELYRIIHDSAQQPGTSYPVITTDKTGIFVLVTK